VTPAIVAKAPAAQAAATTTATPFNTRILPLFRFAGRSPAAAPASALGTPQTEGAPSSTGQNLVQPAPVSIPPAAPAPAHCQCVEMQHPVGGNLPAACLDHLGDDPHSWCYVPLGAACEPAAIPDPDTRLYNYQRWHCNDTSLQRATFEPDANFVPSATSAVDNMVHGLEATTGSATGPLDWELAEEDRYCAGSIDLGPVTSATQCQEKASADLSCGPALHSNGALCYCVPAGHTCESTISEDGNDVYMFRTHSGAGSDVPAAVSASSEAEAGVQAAAIGTSALDAVAADLLPR